MSIILLVIGFIGLSFFANTYFYKPNATNNTAIPMYKNELFVPKKTYNPMKICAWKINGFDIQDMVLFAQLAYRHNFTFIYPR